jgi:hypothetical protein
MAWKFSAGDRIQRGLWPTTVIVAAMTVAAPLTAAVYGQISGAKELEITARKHELDTRTAFLVRAMDSTYGPENRANALRFLRAVSTRDSAMLDWTDRELRVVEVEAETLKKETAKPKERLSEPRKAEPVVRGLTDRQSGAVEVEAKTLNKENSKPKEGLAAVAKAKQAVKKEEEDLADADEDERRKL